MYLHYSAINLNFMVAKKKVPVVSCLPHESSMMKGTMNQSTTAPSVYDGKNSFYALPISLEYEASSVKKCDFPLHCRITKPPSN